MRHNEVPRHLAEKGAMIAFDHEWEGARHDGQGGKRPDWDSLSNDDREKRIRAAAYILASAGEEIIGANVSRDPPQDMAVGMGQPSDLTGDPDKSSGSQEEARQRKANDPNASLVTGTDPRAAQLNDPKFQRDANKEADQVQKDRDKLTADENEKNARLGVRPLDKKDTDTHAGETAATEEEVAKQRASAPPPKPTSASPSPNPGSKPQTESAGSKKR